MNLKIPTLLTSNIRLLAVINKNAFSTCSANIAYRQFHFPRKGPVKQVILHKEIIDKQKIEDASEKHDTEEINMADLALLQRLQNEAEANDMPIPGLANPYIDPPAKCILCEHNVDLDYKNIRLLSQFVSPYTGQIYGRKHTGLCLYMQKRVAKLIKRARFFGFLPYRLKDPDFLRDPKLFDPFRGPFQKKQHSS